MDGKKIWSRTHIYLLRRESRLCEHTKKDLEKADCHQQRISGSRRAKDDDEPLEGNGSDGTDDMRRELAMMVEAKRATTLSPKMSSI